MAVGVRSEPPKGGRGTRSRRNAGEDSGDGKGRGGRTAVALVFTLLIFGALGGGVWYGAGKIQSFFVAADYGGAGTGAVEIEVAEGDTAYDIGDTLAKRDVVKSSKAFVEAAKKDPRSRGIAPGAYQMRLKMRAADALTLLLDPKSRVTNAVTIAEGKIARDVYTMFSEKTGIPLAEFEAAAKDPVALGVPESWFAREDGKPVNKSVEGFLFPARYEIPKQATAQQLLSMMIKKFFEVTTGLDFPNQATKLGISPYEALISASIVEMEAPYANDRAKVARVIYNRLFGDAFPQRVLQMDSAVNYWLRAQGKSSKESKDLLDQELHNPDNPYNTHDNPGFPPGPICNPGEGSLRAAIAPDPDKTILFFVAIDKNGNTAFSKTMAEHEQNIEKAKKNGVM